MNNRCYIQEITVSHVVSNSTEPFFFGTFSRLAKLFQGFYACYIKQISKNTLFDQ